MELPDIIYELIGKYFLAYNNAINDNEKKHATEDFVSGVMSFFPNTFETYISFLCDEFHNIALFRNLASVVEEKQNKYVKNAESLISKYKLQRYRTLIIENCVLSLEALLNIAQHIYKIKKDIDEVCQVFCQLGYPTFNDRFSNEEYLIEMIKRWTVFGKNKGYSEEHARYNLLCEFCELDDEDSNSLPFGEKKGVWAFYPFTSKNNINGLIDFIIKYGSFNTPDDFSSSIRVRDIQDEYRYRFDTLGYTHEEILIPWFYTFIFNTVEANHKLHSLFPICIYVKWLNQNLGSIRNFLPELSDEALRFVLLEYAKFRFSTLSPIPTYDHLEYVLHGSLSKDEVTLINLMYDLKENRTITNRELIDFWKFIVIKSNLVYTRGLLINTPSNLQIVDSDYSDNGTIMLPWKYVRYLNEKAFFYHPFYKKGENGHLPFGYRSKIIREEFDNMSKGILWNLPPILCKVKNGCIINIDEEYVGYAISVIAEIYEYMCLSSKTGYRGCNARDVLMKYKSQQLIFLESLHLYQYPIISLLEQAVHSKTEREEPALIFTTGHTSDTITLVYENVFISRATYIFIVKIDDYENVLEIIKDYFASDDVNKRSELQYSRDTFSRSKGFLDIKRIIHDDDAEWRSSIMFYSKNNANS